ncbi:unnamed protein product [Rotaria magnacalcarata]|uniref:NAD(P)(+)--arginine ADP-ribosyltransferase n=2 Tax=Rotaria magnacalcarata TaxID=392030 RepID=A0A816YZA7_9BILA|nr:unnamed protein product [Rotaria magnacalcarata]CAF1603321.1 unnamed protein product [Rotaria magnacalcarata]CAF2075898.1 unnamed protein product [Rotaria magnacalcarata]CAF2127936.1 unnamed protein product [Rotaria magnacalcarata]CAF2176765.1 unnamed protein product [Rotaria magnacalcarata]
MLVQRKFSQVNLEHSKSNMNIISPIRLMSVRPLLQQSTETKFIWLFQSNKKLSDRIQCHEWIPYHDEILSSLEKAFKNGVDKIFIDEIHQIDFVELLELSINDPTHQRPIRRCLMNESLESERRLNVNSSRCDRLSFPLVSNSQSTCADTAYQGSKFVRDWLLKFTNGKLEVKYDQIFPALINGLILEGCKEPKTAVDEIIRVLNSSNDACLKMNERKRMKKLQDCCIKLYTKQCYLFRAVNTALKDDDRTKLDTLGPYCYVVYNSIGHPTNSRHFLQKLNSKKSKTMTVYRGDSAPRTIIEEYRQAVGQKDKYFKWLPFVSTSMDRLVAEGFALNVLYIIEIERYFSMDQYTDLEKNSYCTSEQEVILKPGTRFQVTSIDVDNISGRQVVHIKMIPSYISILR